MYHVLIENWMTGTLLHQYLSHKCLHACHVTEQALHSKSRPKLCHLLHWVYTTVSEVLIGLWNKAKSHLGLVSFLSRDSLPPSSKSCGRLALVLLGNSVSREAAQLGLMGSMCFPGTNGCTHQVSLILLLRFLYRYTQAC